MPLAFAIAGYLSFWIFWRSYLNQEPWSAPVLIINNFHMAQVVTPNSCEVPKKLKIWLVLTDTSQALAPSFNSVFPF